MVLDTDPGIDDALAILLALASPEVELAGLTVIGGNCSLPAAVRNALDVLALGGAPHIPVAAGVARPLLRPPLLAPETHGDSGLGHATLTPAPTEPVADHAVDLLIRELLATPGQVTLVAIGPLTNIALALRKEPRIVQAVRRVIIMGGALRVEGNTTPLAEFNIYADPHAAHMVLHSGMPVVLLPWDITRDILLTQADIARLTQIDSPLTRFVADATRFYIDFHLAHFGTAGCAINDPAALALAFAPDLAQTTPLYVDVELTSELTMGKTVGDFLGTLGHAPNVQLVTAFDTPRFLDFFHERMHALAQRLGSSA
jgi:purine nucleosidase